MLVTTASQDGPQLRFLVRDANGPNPMLLSEPYGNFKQTWKHLYVLVAVDVSRMDARVSYLLNLRVPLVLHFGEWQRPAGGAGQETFGSVFQAVHFLEEPGARLTVGGW